MKTGILGGTFDPIHNAHLLIAQSAYEQLGLDKLLIMPNAVPPHKRRSVTRADIRCEMVLAAIADVPYFELCEHEVRDERVSYTVNTLTYFRETYPEDELYFIIGSDSLRDFSKWYRPEKIASLCALAVYPRRGDDTKKLISEFGYGTKPHIIEAPLFDISSTLIRERVKNGQSVKYMVPDAVIRIIEREQLYK